MGGKQENPLGKSLLSMLRQTISHKALTIRRSNTTSLFNGTFSYWRKSNSLLLCFHRVKETVGVDNSATPHSNATWKTCAKSEAGIKSYVLLFPPTITRRFVTLVLVTTRFLLCGGASIALPRKENPKAALVRSPRETQKKLKIFEVAEAFSE